MQEIDKYFILTPWKARGCIPHLFDDTPDFDESRSPVIIDAGASLVI